MSFVVDLLATCSIVGIWPRYIEPKRLKTTHLTWQLPPSAAHLDKLKIVHLTDLHFNRKTSSHFLNKVVRTVTSNKPDLILFTGDFLCYSELELEESERLKNFLNQLKAPQGCYCIFGNHDYARYVSLTKTGWYDLLPPPNPLKGVLRGLRTLFSAPTAVQGASARALAIPFHDHLCQLLNTTPFKLLENTTMTLPCGLNLTGLGDYALGRCLPEKAFAGYQKHLPGIVLSHNPDTFPLLKEFPGDWVLSGHTHGEQIHLPWPKWGRSITRKLARLQNAEYTRGLFNTAGKTLYVNRGLGCHKPFRLFSPPEVCIIEAVK